MRIALLHPCDRSPLIQRYQIGLLSMVASLSAAGHEATYIAVGEEEVDINPAFDAVGIYAIDCNIHHVARIAKALRHRHHVMLGGPAAIIAPEWVSSLCAYDSLCTGEGERAIVEFADRYGREGYKNLRGFWFDSGAIRNPHRDRMSEVDLRALPHPSRRGAFDEIQRHYMQSMAGPFTHVYATRGCPFSCAYCSNAAYNAPGARIITRHPDQVIAEIVDAGRFVFPKIVIFEDDILNANETWFAQMSDAFRSGLHEARGTHFEMNTRVGTMTPAQVELAARSGCSKIRFGVESGSEEIRRRMGRNTMTNQDMLDLADTVIANGLDLYVCSIIGVPTETPALFDETRRVVDAIYGKAIRAGRKCTVILNSYYPLHGTPLGDECFAQGLAKTCLKGIQAHVDYCLDTPAMSREFVLEQQRRWRADFSGMIPMAEAIR
jgi:anaerobic magnesium-protoporphyrin IX monomethyl ester cyclase